MASLGAPRPSTAPAPTRVVIDLRPLQEPERTPITGQYLDALLRAYAADPLPGETFVPVLRALRADPSVELGALGLPIAARRWLPPTRVFRSASLTLDPFLLRGAEARTGRGATSPGSAGVVYHTAGGAAPLGSAVPVVATLLDLAPWELPERYARTAAARFGHRLLARVLHDARRVIVPGRSVAEAARLVLRLPAERISVVPLAPSDPFVAGTSPAAVEALRAELGLPERYLVFAGRYDARKDLETLFAALAALQEEATPPPAPWPPTLVLASARSDGSVAEGAPAGPSIAGVDVEHPAVRRLAEHHGVANLVRFPPLLTPSRLAALVAGARALVYPALTEATGLPVLDALAVGTPVVASGVGVLPETVGAGGIVAGTRDPSRWAAALRAVWSDDALHLRIAGVVAARAVAHRRTWQDVARETRAVYAAAAADAGR